MFCCFSLRSKFANYFAFNLSFLFFVCAFGGNQNKNARSHDNERKGEKEVKHLHAMNFNRKYCSGKRKRKKHVNNTGQQK